jgi:hypothetical protein
VYLLVSDRGGALAGKAATDLLDSRCAPTEAPTEVLADFHVRPRPGLRVRVGAVAPDELCVTYGCRTTSYPRTADDLAR